MSEPTQRVVLHVGTPKSGTTYLQNLMWHSRARLLEGGLLYPGNRAQDHFWAAVDVRNDGYLDAEDPNVPGAWMRLVDAARAHHGTTVISQELFGDRSADDVARVMSDLDFAEVHVVVTARDLGRQLPASWQEDLKNRHYMTFGDWLDAVRPGSDREEWSARTFWLRQDLPAVLRRWRADLPSERLHVVTVPRRGSEPGLLWSRFAGVLDVDPQLGSPSGAPNKSLGWVESELLRRINERADYSIDWPLYAARVTGSLAQEILPERPGAVPLSLPAGEREWVSAHADAMIAEVAEAGYHVVGDLAELRVDPEDDADGVPTVTDSDLLDAALDAMVAVLAADPAVRASGGTAVAVPDARPPMDLRSPVRRAIAGAHVLVSGDALRRRALWRRLRHH
jgi:hypothetical protein